MKTSKIELEVGCRYLLYTLDPITLESTSIREYNVAEYSPSRTWVKLRDSNGSVIWYLMCHVVFVEKLHDIITV